MYSTIKQENSDVFCLKMIINTKKSKKNCIFIMVCPIRLFIDNTLMSEEQRYIALSNYISIGNMNEIRRRLDSYDEIVEMCIQSIEYGSYEDFKVIYSVIDIDLYPVMIDLIKLAMELIDTTVYKNLLSHFRHLLEPDDIRKLAIIVFGTDLDLCQILIEKTNFTKELLLKGDDSPFCIACFENKSDILKFLIDKYNIRSCDLLPNQIIIIMFNLNSELIKYFITQMKFKKTDMKFVINGFTYDFVTYIVRAVKNLELFRFLAKHFRYTKNQVKSDKLILRQLSYYADFDIVQCLIREYGYKKTDFDKKQTNQKIFAKKYLKKFIEDFLEIFSEFSDRDFPEILSEFSDGDCLVDITEYYIEDF